MRDVSREKGKTMTVSTLWYLAQLKPNAFERARLNLERQNLQTFMPLREGFVKRGRVSQKIVEPLFKGYIFIGADPEFSEWSRVNNTYGVSRLVTFGNNETVSLPQELIEGLKARCGEGECLLSKDKLNIGDHVRIISGPFADYVATVETISSETRLSILFDIMGQKKRAKINRVNIEKLDK